MAEPTALIRAPGSEARRLAAQAASLEQQAAVDQSAVPPEEAENMGLMAAVAATLDAPVGQQAGAGGEAQ